MILKKSSGTTGQSKIRIIFVAVALLAALAALPLAACSGGSSDPSSWKTLGEGLSQATEAPNYGFDDNYFVCEFESNGTFYRVVTKMDPSIRDQIYDLDFSDEDYNSKLVDIVGGLSVVSAEDITADMLSQDNLNALVGKTGQELIDEGFVFESYFMYGGEQTGASFSKGYFSYSFTFDVSITEEQSEDEGASLKDANVVAVDEFINIADAAIDPAKVE